MPLFPFREFGIETRSWKGMLAELEQSPRWVSRWDWDIFSKFCQESQQIFFFLSRKLEVCWESKAVLSMSSKAFLSCCKCSEVRARPRLGLSSIGESLGALVLLESSAIPLLPASIKQASFTPGERRGDMPREDDITVRKRKIFHKWSWINWWESLKLMTPLVVY